MKKITKKRQKEEIEEKCQKGYKTHPTRKTKKMYGKTFMGIERSTFLIDADGKIARVWPKVKVDGHVAEVLDAVRAL